MLSGVNTADFSITSTTCGSSLAANTSCERRGVFSPLAAGVRTTALILADNASGSPQSVTINGTAAGRCHLHFNGRDKRFGHSRPTRSLLHASDAGDRLQRRVAFTCAGSPTGAACNAPGVTLSNNATTNFSVTVTTSGSASLTPFAMPGNNLRSYGYPGLARSLLAFLFLCLYSTTQKSRSARTSPSWRMGLGVACLALALIGCGGGGGKHWANAAGNRHSIRHLQHRPYTKRHSRELQQKSAVAANHPNPDCEIGRTVSIHGTRESNS